MTTDWGRVEAAFEAALRLTDAAARSAYLARLAGDEPRIAAEVQALLSAETGAGRFLDGIGEQTRQLEAFTFQPGQLVGRYRIEACLAAGGMGVVYSARDEQLERAVALKFLARPGNGDPAQRQRLMDEARWASRLDHPNVCTVHEVGETEAGHIFIVMALCPGEDLGRRLRRASLTVEAILKLGLQLTEALMAAHGAGVLHRDLKPGNVIVDDAGGVRLVDFGIAAASGVAVVERAPAGTLAYMAPEQIDGAVLDERCDIWGVGALLFEALTGRRPFPGRDGLSPGEFGGQSHAAPPPGSLVSGVPPALDALVQRCLQPEPDARFADAADLHAALRGLLRQCAPEALAAAPARPGPETSLVLDETGDAGVARYLTVLAVDAGEASRQPSVREAVLRFGGHEVIGTAPGVLLAVFGYPVADEFAALRAARCAQGLPESGAGVAVASGPGWFREAGSSAPVSVGGEVFQRARALLGQAGTGAPVLDAATARLTNGRLAPAMAARGAAGEVSGPVLPPRLTPLTGRVHELGLLCDAWARCLEDEQQAILIGGEPGIGKTRLVRELMERIAGEDEPLIIECPASPHQMSSPLHPVIGYLVRVLGFHDGKAARHLEALLRRHGLTDPVQVASVARTLGVPDPPGAAGVMLSPEREKEKGLDGLVRLLLARARRQPCLLVLEDLHWADPTTLSLLERLWQAASAVRLLVVCTHRPEFQPPWSAAPGVSQIRLARLRREEARAMAEAVTSATGVDTACMDEILERCDGVPLFIEELAADLVSGRGPEGGIPWTLQDSLLGRLERLGDARQVAHSAAVAGRSVAEDVLGQLVALDPAALSEALRTLQRGGVMLAEGGTPPIYRFKHALIRDAAYTSLAEDARQALHGQVAEALESPATVARPTPEQLARHREAAGDHARAADHWSEAAALALGRFAVTEAEHNARRGLAVVRQLPEGPERAQRELTLCTMLGPALMAAKGYADAEVNAVYSHARALCAALEDPPEVFPVLFGLWTFHCVRARHGEALALADAMVAMARRSEQRELLTEAHMVRGITRYFTGAFAGAAEDLATAWSACEGEDLAMHALRYGQDPAMVIRSYQSWNAWQLGSAEQSDAFSEEAVGLARASRHPFSIAYGLTFAAWHAMNRSEPERARQLLVEAIALCREHRIQVFLALALALDALRRIGGDDAAGALTAMEESLKVYRATGAELFLPAWYAAMAQAAAGAGRFQQASTLMDEALAASERSGERWCLAEIYRGRALLALAGEGADAAGHWLAQSRTMAQAQDARAWLARIDATAGALTGSAPGTGA